LDVLIRFLLGEVAVALALFILLLIIMVWRMLRKTVVTVPSMSLVVEKIQYDHGETVNVSGIVFSDVDKPAAGETAGLKLTDAASAVFDVGTAVTGADGKYAASFAVPSDVAPGGVTITARDEALGIEATATFTLKEKG